MYMNVYLIFARGRWIAARTAIPLYFVEFGHAAKR